MSKKAVTVTLSEDLLDRIDTVAESRGESRSGVVERLCRNGIDSEERFARLLGHPLGGVLLSRLANPDVMTSLLLRVVGENLSHEEQREIQRLLADSAAKSLRPDAGTLAP